MLPPGSRLCESIKAFSPFGRGTVIVDKTLLIRNALQDVKSQGAIAFKPALVKPLMSSRFMWEIVVTAPVVEDIGGFVARKRWLNIKYNADWC